MTPPQSMVPDERFAAYGITGSDLAALRARFADWATTITGIPTTPAPAAAPVVASPARRATEKRPWPTDAAPPSLS